MDEKQAQILRLKEEKNAVIMAHYYVDDNIQEIADYVGDSYYLSEMATRVKEKTIVLCGVSFMGESAKLLNPEKRVLLPDLEADCPMAHMASVEKIEEVRAAYKEDDGGCLLCQFDGGIESSFRCVRYVFKCAEGCKGPSKPGHLFYSGQAAGDLYFPPCTGKKVYF